MRSLFEAAGLVLVAVLAAGGMWLVTGGPDRRVPCDSAALEAGQICLETVLAGEDVEVLWVDARPRVLWERNGLPGSVLLTDDAAEDFDDLLAGCFQQLAEADLVVVYCNQEGCGSSKAVADKIRSTGLAEDVRVLFGGWKALHGSGLVGAATGPR